MAIEASSRFKGFVNAKRRFTDFVERKFSIRVHMWLILIATVLSGVLFSRCLLAFRITSMGVRYPIAVLLSYAAFFAFIKLWFLFVVDADQSSHALIRGGSVKGPGMKGKPEDEEAIVDEAIKEITIPGLNSGSGTMTAKALEEAQAVTGAQAASSENVGQALGASVDLADAGFAVGDLVSGGEGCAVGCFAFVFVGVLVGSIYLGSAWLILEAPSVLSEALFQFLLAGSLMKRMRQMEAPNWVGGVFGLTWKPFFIAAILATGTGYFAGITCPLAVKFSDVLHCSHSNERHQQFLKNGLRDPGTLPAELPPSGNPKGK